MFNRVKRPPVEQNNKRRCVLLSNLNESMGLNSVLQQVCGGPLEKLTVLSNGKIELFFIFPEHAKQFYTYGKATGLLMVNGVKLKVEWLNDENNLVNSTLSSSLMSDILHNGCRRCLIISKNIPGKRIRNGDKMFYPEPDIHYSTNLNFEEIKNDFNKFGKVLDIGSVISRKLCFSIFYYDIRCAILAKQELDLIGSELNKNIKIGLFGMVKISLIVLVLSYDNQGYLNSCYNKQPTNQPKDNTYLSLSLRYYVYISSCWCNFFLQLYFLIWTNCQHCKQISNSS